MRKSKSDALSDRIHEKIAFEKRLDEVDKESCRGCRYKFLFIETWCSKYKHYQPYCSDLSLVQETLTQAQTTYAGLGRIETRTLIASTALVGYSDWPGLQQVFRLEHTVRVKKTGSQHHETTYGVTSLPPPRADARRLLLPTRGHWRVEAGHWIRDVTFDEDRSQVRWGHIPQVMAALRNTTLAVLRCAGETNIAAACRRLAAQPTAALALIDPS